MSGILGIDVAANLREKQLTQLIAEQAAPYQPGAGLIVDPLPMVLRIFDVEHGACAIISGPDRNRIAMIDSGHNSTTGWRPSKFIREGLNRKDLEYLFITNFDQDHISDLDNVCTELNVHTITRNTSAAAEDLRRIKQQSGPLTDDAKRFLALHGGYTGPVAYPFNTNMGGVTYSAFNNRYPDFIDTNNLSMVVFIKYAGWKILFAGDLERAGWLALLQDATFVAEWRGTAGLVASHHGRENGFCQELFDIHRPQFVVMSDKAIVHDTQLMAGRYHDAVLPAGVNVRTTAKRRHVLTTRRDGDILLTVDAQGNYFIDTTKQG
jgi:beta-lactamase superfamily II metal-dependent hydrolase